MSITWNLNNNPASHVRERTAREVAAFVERFCRSANRGKMQENESVFVILLNEYAYYSMSRNHREAKTRANELTALTEQ